MDKKISMKEKIVLDGQQEHWKNTYEGRPDFFGREPSYAARQAAAMFQQAGKTKIIELGGGHGRDTLFFAQKGFQVYVLDYSPKGLEVIHHKAASLGLAEWIIPVCHDVRKPLPFEDETFDACYSHMLYCMALTTAELELLSQEVWRILKPRGLNLYTVRHTGDSHYGTGIHRGEDMYEVGGFIVHFFSKEKVEHLSRGYEILGLEEFEEGPLPRKLFLVKLHKPARL